MEEDYRASSYDYDELFVKSLGDPVSLTYNPSSQLYKSVASKCRILHGRFLPTPWLSSPHLQTAFLSLVEKSPHVTYKRHMFYATDGGTIALDWLMSSDGRVHLLSTAHYDHSCLEFPNILFSEKMLTLGRVVITYVKHLVDKMAKHGWNVVVSNHRGLGGISITSDCFYNAGWTEDVRKVIDHIHCQYPEAPLYAVGTSIGANIVSWNFDPSDVLLTLIVPGEISWRRWGLIVLLVGAAAVCSPWDL
ncbi:hypothetical protein POTOM_060332 [Populus tomentosa]|uniref:Serine aminopeptidase S33 domain-containing protein n=1 Tax=Populus tomentosa TaxID=118781 RepID=A0A8X7XU12_POPTO|nr:hypothetical protein POTOM_060332 [Populus tomentosa]